MTKTSKRDQQLTTNTPFRIWGPGIFALNQPRYATAKEAHDDLERYARSVNQTPLMFTVYKDLDSGEFQLA